LGKYQITFHVTAESYEDAERVRSQITSHLERLNINDTTTVVCDGHVKKEREETDQNTRLHLVIPADA
jgi:ribosome-associated translation inhibitor RaiA